MGRTGVLTSLAARIRDYRIGEIAPIDADHINRWVNQFDRGVHIPLLTELDHVLTKSYLSRSTFDAFVADVITNRDVARDDPCAFWARSRFFNKQLRGASQKELLKLFGEALHRVCGLSVDDCGADDGPMVYLDDGVYTGMHILNDLTPIISEAPQHTDLYMIVLGVHSQGRGYATQELTRRFRAAGKSVELNWFWLLGLENTSPLDSDVLWPKSIPDLREAREYAASLRHPPVLRRGESVGRNEFFSSGAGRDLLEQEFLKAGALIRSGNQSLKRYARPLGNCILESLGLGALIVTFRNCANNCPLVFWAGDHPLFPRNNN